MGSERPGYGRKSSTRKQSAWPSSRLTGVDRIIFCGYACELRRFGQHSLWPNPDPGGTSPAGWVRCKSLLAGQLQSQLRIVPEKVGFASRMVP